MRDMTKELRIPILVGIALLVFATAAMAHILIKSTEPGDGETVDRPPRTLRVWFNRAPDVSKSELHLTGPDGELELEGLHTMGDDDLMVRIVGRVPDGEYTAKWKAAGDDGHEREGSWTFAVKRPAP